jgi:nitrile hydratase beta subunit
MNGIHDMGGMDGFGKVQPEPNEPVFHAPWEGRVLAMSRAFGTLRCWNIDQSRFVVEQMPPAVYLSVSYYKKWHLRNETLALQHGLVTAEELAAGHAQTSPRPVPGKPLKLEDVDRSNTRGMFSREPQGAARFKPGDKVRAKNIHPAGHTRLPRYARGKVGVIERLHGAHVYPDSLVGGRGEDPQWLYTVVFKATELWGADADPTLDVSVEAFEPYLDPA